MKRFLKWAGIAFAALLLVIAISIAVICIRHHRYNLLSSGGKLSPNQAAFDVTFYDLNLKILAEEEKIEGYVNVDLRCLRDSLDRVQLQLVNSLKVTAVSRQNRSLSFEHKKNSLRIDLASPAHKNQLLRLKITYSGSPVKAIKPPWVGGFNWSTDKNGHHWIGVSCQGEGAKVWFPCKDHPSDEPDSAALNITVPKSYYCAANGVLRRVEQPEKDWLTYCWITRYPINNYNITINVAQYDILERAYYRQNGETMPVYFYTLPDFAPQADSLIDMAVDMLYTYRKYFGEYPFAEEKFGIAHTDYLGMEHQTMNSYGNAFRKKTLGGVEYDQLMLHEMAHEWWGNKVTAKSWSDFWIHEGIGTYGEALYLLEKGGESAYHAFFDSIRPRIRNRKPLIVKENATSMQAYHSDIYYKGAYLMHTLRFVVGDSTLFKTLYAFVNDSACTYNNLVTTADFIAQFSDSEVRELLSFYLYSAELPRIEVRAKSDTAYAIAITNVDFSCPVEIEHTSGTNVYRLGPDPVTVVSTQTPVIDPEKWYLKTVIHQKKEPI